VVAIGLSAGAVARIRFSISGLWEVVASVRVLRDPVRHAVHLPWVARVRQPLTNAGLAGPTGRLLWQLVPSAPGYLADFLTPPPSGLAAGLDAELAVLCATPPAAVRADLAAYAGARSGALDDLYADPTVGLHRLADEIRLYWRIAMAPYWNALRARLEADVFARGRRLTEGGSAAVLDDLHRHVRWDEGTLSVAHPTCTALDVPEAGDLVLIPSVFVWPSVLSIAGTVSQLAYPARGVGDLWTGSPAVPDGLRSVLGRGRAQILAELAAPLSTTELARRTGMSAGGVSQHLTALRAAGLVATHRDGRRVLNMRTQVAEALLARNPVRLSASAG
jgi:DNA-binding transcriptional ArsR family regulator